MSQYQQRLDFIKRLQHAAPPLHEAEVRFLRFHSNIHNCRGPIPEMIKALILVYTPLAILERLTQ